MKRRPVRQRSLRALAVALLLVVAGCGGDTVDEITLVTHSSFDISEDVLAAFEAETGVTVRLLDGGDAGEMLAQAILTKDNPTADVLFGVDNTFLSRALAEDLFVAYEPPALENVPIELQLDPDHRVTPIDFGDVCLNIDRAAFQTTPPPQTLRDLTRPEYRGRLVVENPATSSPGLAFLLATIAAFPEDADYSWRDFWTELRANDVEVAAGWEEAYYSSFSGAAGEGDRPIVVSYASSPPAEVIFAEEPLAEAPTAVVVDGCFRQIEFAGILAGSDGGSAAERLIDFMLSKEFQEDIPLRMFVFPARRDAQLPAEFVAHTVVPESPRTVDPDDIEANRDRWIEEWTDLVVR